MIGLPPTTASPTTQGSATQTAAQTAGEIAKAAKGLEAFFLRQLLSTMHPEDTSSLDGGFAGGTFHEMLDGAMADKVADSGGIGLARTIEHDLANAMGAPAASTTAVPTQRALRAYAPAPANEAPALDVIPIATPAATTIPAIEGIDGAPLQTRSTRTNRVPGG